MTSQYYTGDAVGTSGFSVLLRFPTSQLNWVYSCFLAALFDLGQPFNWATGGETTPDEAAQLFEDIFDAVAVNVVTVGDVKWTAAADPGSNWLRCDGALYNNADFPDLFSVIGTTFNIGGEPPNTFRVPDLRGRAAAGPNSGSGRLPGWANALGGSGGESDHTLNVSEMPAHSHNVSGTGLVLVTAAPPVVPDALAPNPLPVFTGNTGGGGSHNNVQPTLILYPFILSSI